MKPTIPPPAVWTAGLQIHSYDVNVTRHATAQALFRYFLEAAWNHAEALGVGFSHLAAQERAWVLARLLFRIQRPPCWGETVTLATWPRGVDSLFALRDFEFSDPAGKTLAAGTSNWLVINLRTRRPQRLDSLLNSLPGLSEKRALEREPRKLPAVDFPPVGVALTARPSDIDVNAHVNSARYLEWMLDTYPLEFHQNHRPEVLEINYLGETLAGDSLMSLSKEASPVEWCHSIRNSNGAEVCRARFTWRADGEARSHGISPTPAAT